MGKKRLRRPELLPEKLLRIRINLGLTQKEMVEIIRVSKTTERSSISRYEDGSRIPTLIELCNYSILANLLTHIFVTAEDLMDDSKNLPF